MRLISPPLRLFCCATIFAVTAAACSDDEAKTYPNTGWEGGTGTGGSTVDDAGTGGAGGGSGTGGTQATGGAGGSTGTGGSAPVIPYCQQTCSTASNCAIPNSFPASEYACESNVCKYLGCSSDAVCAQVYKTDQYVCRPGPYGSTTKLCQHKCSVSSDCATDTGAFSADNYTCQGDYCVYDGCKDDAECKATMQGLDYRCAEIAGTSVKMCQKGCSVAADCAVPNSPAYAASTWECKDSTCHYLGCPSDAACKASMSNDNYACK